MYPPNSDGGYPLLCREAVEELRSRGHDVLVLTGDMGCNGSRVREANVWRIFAYCPDNKENELKSGRFLDVVRWYRREWAEHGLLREALAAFRPQVVFVWATKGLSHSVAIALQRTGLPFIAYVCGYWLNHHNQEAHLRRQFQFWSWGRKSGWGARAKAAAHRFLSIRLPLDYVPLRFDALAYNSSPMLTAIEPLDASRTAPVQIVDSSRLERFQAGDLPRLGPPFRILFVGRLHPSKDPITLIRALGVLQADPLTPPMELTLLGWQHDAAYISEIRNAISALPRPAAVEIRDPVSFEAMPALFAGQQILVVPSVVDPLPRVAAEAMAAGLVCVVSDKTGISALLVDRQEAMIFPAANVGALAECLRMVMRDSALTRSLQQDGRKKAVEFFSTRRMVNEMEGFLASGVKRAATRDPSSQAPEPRPAGPLGAPEDPRSGTRDASTS